MKVESRHAVSILHVPIAGLEAASLSVQQFSGWLSKIIMSMRKVFEFHLNFSREDASSLRCRSSLADCVELSNFELNQC